MTPAASSAGRVIARRAAALLGAWCLAAGASADHPRSLAPADLVERLARAQAPAMLDVRTPAEFAAGHLPGAVNIPVDQLRERLGELASLRDRELLVYCETGRRAGVAVQGLGRAGFAHLRLLDGHMRRWRGEARALAR